MKNKSYHEGTWEVLDSFYETMLSQRLLDEEHEDTRDNDTYLLYYNALSDVESFHPDYTFEGEEIDLDTKDLWIKEKQEQLAKMKESNSRVQEVELYYYDGFSEPKKITNVDEITIESNYLGDKTDEFMEEYNIEVNQSSLEELQENQFFATYNIWVNPTKEQLQEFNKSLLLDENEHLQNFKGYEKLYKDRQVNNVFELER